MPKSSRRKLAPYLCAFDSEDDGQATPFLFCFVHEGGTCHRKTAGEALETLYDLQRRVLGRGFYVEAWATNLEYDLNNLFGPDRIAEVTLRFGKSHLISARWRGIEFRDTVRHVPASVKELGQQFGMPKLGRDKSVAYCMRDARITYRAARELKRIYRSLGIEPKTTLASTAYRLWETVYFKRRPIETRSEIVRDAREGYHGGRTEPFSVGVFERVHVIDAASMFPWAMVAGPFPECWGPVERAARGSEPDLLGIYRARVTIRPELGIPPLPFRTAEGTVYPVGQWSGWYTGLELRYAAGLGHGVRVLGGYRFGKSCKPFTRYVPDLFQRKNAARGPLRLLYKLLLNGLYGKFGQGGSRVQATPLARFDKLRRIPTDVRVWNGLAIYRVDARPPYWGNNVWAAIVTARARVRLHQEMEHLRTTGSRVLYCDTDSVIYQAPKGKRPRYPERATEPGQFESRGRFRALIIVGKKEYALERSPGKWDVHVKGVPFAERMRYLTEGSATFQRPVRLLESGRIGIRANVWRTVSKQRHVSYEKRIRKADGSLGPVQIEPGS